MSQLEGERILTPNDQPIVTADVSKRKQQLQQPRQLLSCTKCRERKVKVWIPTRSSGAAPSCTIHPGWKNKLVFDVVVI